ncbi:selenocysteine lyase/cysteine desulfurase [Kibdelosporangium banguiense]|uniref:Selenocysteine lyase/cysteine desulfurase n=1 Tax=Kibdelosporangium banguiense TaxID=1365924 RepID=A0ABS4TNA0_9PSEU|nr:kynureninase [Kibdelosporangium banguiense]MBP2325479.1 selenocysteine lyase/cysteine desulfurase [Kibdelosporangium banguiense]
MNDLARHYSKFGVSGRLLLSGHSHQAWPDVALDGQIEAFQDAASHVDEKWERAFAKADRVRDGFRVFLGEPDARIALGQNTHELVLRFLSALDLKSRPRLVTTNGEFHTLRRQLNRLAETDLDVVFVDAEPVETLAARLADAVDAQTSAVLVSAVLFETSRIVPGLGSLASVCVDHDVELLVDAYHALGPVPFTTADFPSAWVVGGGYKYLQLGEGNCFLRLPAHADNFRPVITGWYAEFAELAEHHPGAVSYPLGATRYAGSTYDPTSHYRAARVFDFFAGQGLTPARLREIVLQQTGLLATLFAGMSVSPELISISEEPRENFGGFVSLRTAKAPQLQAQLASRGVLTDSRGDYLRLGPAPYLSDDQLRGAMDILASVLREI